MPSELTCFVCCRCDYPICTKDDIILETVAGGTTDEAFQYELEDLLDLPKPVPCYSRREITSSSVYVSPKLLDLPLSSKAKVHAIQAVAESENAQGRSIEEFDRTIKDILKEEASSLAALLPSSDCVLDDSSDEMPGSPIEERQEEETTSPIPVPVEERAENFPHYTSLGQTAESRIDIIAVRQDVLGRGVFSSTTGSNNRSDAEPTSHCAARDLFGETTGSSEAEQSGDDADAAVTGTIRQQSTEWRAPGNLTVNEQYIKIKRSTLSFSNPWFNKYQMPCRVECPECRFGLGYVFEQTPELDDESSAAEDVAGGASSSDNGERAFPRKFIGLELKNLKQKDWSIKDFQTRYNESRNLQTIKERFPDAEELISFYAKLSGLRTQVTLYHNLLSRHKEQYDVQSAIMRTQKTRMDAYEDRLKSMQEMINSQRNQLVAQVDRLLSQNDYIKSQFKRLQVQTERFHIEQSISTAKDKTISILRDKVALLERLNARHTENEVDPFEEHMERSPERCDAEGLESEEECSQVSSDLHDNHDNDNNDVSMINTLHTDTDKDILNLERILKRRQFRPSYSDVPPAHLCGVRNTLEQ